MDFCAGLSDKGTSANLWTLAGAVVDARRMDLPVMVMMGGHVIKTGCSPVIISLMEAGMITSVSMNGAASIHDFEIAMIGATSEDVGENVREGKFGMWEETGQLWNKAIAPDILDSQNQGIGYHLGRYMTGHKEQFPCIEYSIIHSAYWPGIPVTIHVAIGTDVVHQHPEANGAIIGQGAMADFYNFVDLVCKLKKGAVVLNFGSAVIMPECFLKAVAMARNMGYPVENFIAGNFDMIDHYRPRENILNRANTGDEGTGYYIAGRHEIMLPLFAHLVLEIKEDYR